MEQSSFLGRDVSFSDIIPCKEAEEEEDGEIEIGHIFANGQHFFTPGDIKILNNFGKVVDQF